MPNVPSMASRTNPCTRAGGDLRVAHFFGIHAEQAIPLLAWSVAWLKRRGRWAAIVAGSAAYAVLAVACVGARRAPLSVLKSVVRVGIAPSLRNDARSRRVAALQSSDQDSPFP
jgi:hypothetical protein